MRNDQVVESWIQGKAAKSGSMQTDGEKLFSYALMIGEHTGGKVKVYNYRAPGDFISRTTSVHVGLALRAAGPSAAVDPL